MHKKLKTTDLILYTHLNSYIMFFVYFIEYNLQNKSFNPMFLKSKPYYVVYICACCGVKIYNLLIVSYIITNNVGYSNINRFRAPRKSGFFRLPSNFHPTKSELSCPLIRCYYLPRFTVYYPIATTTSISITPKHSLTLTRFLNISPGLIHCHYKHT